MRLDKYLKLSKLIKRRVIAKKAADLDLVFVNDKQAKPSHTLFINDYLRLVLGFKIITVKITSFNIKEEMYVLISEEKK
jgi:ribosomal 50S subunit-recycling heat shock protein